MAASQKAEYNKPVKFFDESANGAATFLIFPDFSLQFLYRQEISTTPTGKGGGGSIIYVFELTNASKKKTKLSVVAAAGIRDEGPKFKSNKKEFQLLVSDYNNKPLNFDELAVVTRLNTSNK